MILENINAQNLKEVARLANEKKADIFWEELKPVLFEAMLRNARSGSYGLSFNSADKELNPYGWLSIPCLYKKVIAELESERYSFKVTHNDDSRDGTYIHIEWE